MHFCAVSGMEAGDVEAGVMDREEEDVKGRMRRLRKLGMPAIVARRMRRKSFREIGWEGRLWDFEGRYSDGESIFLIYLFFLNTLKVT